MTKQVVGLFVSDIHWTDKAPVARSAEPDWMAVQAGYVEQLRNLQNSHKAPIFIAGDLFDKWNSSIWLVNHVLQWLWGMDIYAVPGNHDIPHGNYKELPRSAYWTLVESKTIKHLAPGGTHSIGTLTVSPFPPGFEVTPPNKGGGLGLEVALIHQYIWVKDHGHAKATEAERFASWAPRLRGYDVAAYGDNHQSWLVAQKDKTQVLNMGCFMRRHTDEREAKPCVGLLHSDGKFSRHYLDVGGDKFLDIPEEVAKVERGLEIDLGEFAEELSNLHSERVDFIKVCLRWLQGQKDMDPGIKAAFCKGLGVKDEFR